MKWVTVAKTKIGENCCPTETYSAMLKRIVETSEQTGVTLRVGSSKYNKDAQAARKILRGPVAEGGLGWKIIDGGIEE